MAPLKKIPGKLKNPIPPKPEKESESKVEEDKEAPKVAAPTFITKEMVQDMKNKLILEKAEKLKKEIEDAEAKAKLTYESIT